MPIQVPRESAPAPEISVIVPTSGRPDAIVRLLESLARQTIAAARFEVVVTDDGSQPPVAPRLASLALPYSMKCEWQPQSGPAGARNRAIAKARGPLLLILNDDAGPPPDLIERHLAAHRSAPSPRAWLGGFEFAEECETPLAIALTRLDVIFPYSMMQRGGPNPGSFFWTCNLSVPRQPVVDAGGFDESFDKPICEDVELGYRLHQRGVPVWFLDGATCLHHHQVDVGWLVRRQVELGRGMVRLWRKHGDTELLPWLRQAPSVAEFETALERVVTARGIQSDDIAREIDGIDRAIPIDAPRGTRVATAVGLEARIKQVHEDALRLGLLAGLRGWDAARARAWLESLPPLTSIVVPATMTLERLRRLASLAGAPIEVVRSSGELREPGAREDFLAARTRGAQICLVEERFDAGEHWLRTALSALPGRPVFDGAGFKLLRRAQLVPADALALTR